MKLSNDVIWHYKRANDIESNPIEDKYCLVVDGDFVRRYSIMPVYPLDEHFYTEGSAYDEESFGKAKYFVVFQQTGEKRDGIIKLHRNSVYEATFTNVFEDLETAQRYILEFLIVANVYPLSHIADSGQQLQEMIGKIHFE